MNSWVLGDGHGGNMAQWGFEDNDITGFNPDGHDCVFILRVRDANTLVEIDTTTITMGSFQGPP